MGARHGGSISQMVQYIDNDVVSINKELTKVPVIQSKVGPNVHRIQSRGQSGAGTVFPLNPHIDDRGQLTGADINIFIPNARHHYVKFSITNADPTIHFKKLFVGLSSQFTLDITNDAAITSITFDPVLTNGPTLLLGNTERNILTITAHRTATEERYEVISSSGGGAAIPDGTIENEHLEWDNTGKTWNAVTSNTFGATGPFGATGFLRFANDQIIASSRNLADDGDMELKFNGAGLIDFTENANNSVGLQLRAQDAVNPDATLTIIQTSDTGGSGGTVDIDAINSISISISVDGTAYWVYDEATTENRALQDVNMVKRDIKDVTLIEMRDDAVVAGTIVFNPSGAADTAIQGVIADLDRINVFNNNINTWLFTYSAFFSKGTAGIPTGADTYLGMSDHYALFDSMTAPVDADIADDTGAIFFDTSTDPGIFKIKKKSTASVVSTISLEGLAPQTPITEDIDYDGFDIKDISNVEFRDTTGAPATSVGAIWQDSTGLNIQSAAITEEIDMRLGSLIHWRFDEDGELLFVVDNHSIIPQSTALEFVLDNANNEFRIKLGSGSSTFNYIFEEEKFTHRTTTTDTLASTIQLIQNNNTPVNGRTIAEIFFIAENSASVDEKYAQISATSVTVTNGSENGQLQLGHYSNGAIVLALEMEGSASGQKMGFFGTASVIRPTGVAVTDVGIHAALVTLGLITA